MTVNELISMWEQDSKIDTSDLTKESIKIPQLHSKYYSILLRETGILKINQNRYHSLYKDKWEYYLGIMPNQDVVERGWEILRLKIIKADVDVYLQADNDMQEALDKVETSKMKIKFLEEVIKTLNNRNFTIKNCIDFERFKVGA